MCWITARSPRTHVHSILTVIWNKISLQPTRSNLDQQNPCGHSPPWSFCRTEGARFGRRFMKLWRAWWVALTALMRQAQCPTLSISALQSCQLFIRNLYWQNPFGDEIAMSSTAFLQVEYRFGFQYINIFFKGWIKNKLCPCRREYAQSMHRKPYLMFSTSSLSSITFLIYVKGIVRFFKYIMRKQYIYIPDRVVWAFEYSIRDDL